jgi:hypothetical protein
MFALPTTQERYQFVIDVSQSKASFPVERPPRMSDGTVGKGYVDTVWQQVEYISNGFEVVDVAELDALSFVYER